MGRYRPDKEEFDNLTRKFLESQGYYAQILSNRFADVVAWHSERKEFAIVEVKAPSEKDAAIGFRYKQWDYNLAGKSRKEIWESLNQKGCVGEARGIEKLIAFTVSNQLYRYWRLRGEHIKKFCGRGKPVVHPKRVSAFLALPTTYEKIATRIIGCLRDYGVKIGFKQRAGRLLVVEIRYPAPKS